MTMATEPTTALTPVDGESVAADDMLARQKALVALGRRAIAPPESAILMQDAAALLAEMLHADYGLAAELNADETALTIRLVSPGTAQEDSARRRPPARRQPRRPNRCRAMCSTWRCRPRSRI